MKLSRTASFLLAALVGLSAGMPMPATADDTEIYTGGNIQGVKPNLLMILDTSGSMRSFDGLSQSRIDRMKGALVDMLDNIDGVNVGLMRFSDPGGPILYPVKAIGSNANLTTSAGQPDITVPVLFGEDDGEELLSLGSGSPGGRIGEVKLDSFDLNLFDTPAFGTEFSRTVQVRSRDDDAEQSRRFYNNSSTNLEMVADGAGIRTLGYRFENWPANTDGAKFLSSQLFLTPQTIKSGPLDVKIFGLYREDMDSFPSSGRTPGCPRHKANDIYCRLGLDTTAEQRAGINFSNVANYSHTAGSGNITDAIVTWKNVPETVIDEEIGSPDISPVVEEIFNHPNWQFGGGDDDLGIFLTGTTRSKRDIYSRDRNSTLAAKLRVDYAPAGQPFGRQLVALRFRNVRLPQAAIIDKASLQLYAAGESSDALTIKIVGEKVASAPAFKAGVLANPADKLSSRLASNRTAEVSWAIPATETWTRGQQLRTPDISPVIKDIADQSSWCGGNDIVIFLEFDSGAGTKTRRIFSREGDSTLAASLQIDFNESSFAPGTGCTTEDITRQIKTDRDDALEFTRNGFVLLNASDVSVPARITRRGTSGVMSGLIFRNMPVNPGSIIESAVLELTSSLRSTPANAASFTIFGENDDVILAFDNSRNNINKRTLPANRVGTSIPTRLPAVTTPSAGIMTTADISPIVQAIVNRSDWDSGDDVGLILKGGSGLIRAFSHDVDPSKSPRLKLHVRYNVGDVISTTGTPPSFVTVRQRLKEIINGLQANGYTPIVDTLYEASQYYRGKQVLYGASRGRSFFSVRASTRVSHPASYESPPGGVFNPTGCTDANLNSFNCVGQQVTGSPNYISPIEKSCQANFIVLLTDGFANHNNSASQIQTLTGRGCQRRFSNGSPVASGESCGVDLVKYLRNKKNDPAKDLNTNVSGVNTVSTYTIGFNISTQFLKDLAEAGDGHFYTASTSSQLTDVFKAILTDVLNQATSFAAPSLSVNAFNRLEDRNEVYFSLFEPSSKEHWLGNVKKFQICQSSKDACAASPGNVGDVLDSRAPPVIALGSDSRIKDTALSFWTTTADGANVTKGGTGTKVPVHSARRVFTLSEDALGLPGTKSYVGNFENLATAINELVDSDGDGIIDGLQGSNPAAQTRVLLGMGSTAPAADVNKQIDWIRGKDVDSLFPDAEFGANRYTFSDPLHGNPLALTFGGTAADPFIKLVVGTNDGGIRMVNSITGEEEWIFYPPSLLPLQKTLRLNPAAPVSGRSYGVDGSAVPWIQDKGSEIGVINPADGDFVRIFIGQRRGGNNLYALDITPDAKITNGRLLTTIKPKLMWRIRGGTPEFPILGDTWSKPLLTTMLIGTAISGQAIRKTVLIFAGGYESATQDSGFNVAANVGNAIYIVDAESGQRLFYISNVGATDSGGASVHGGAATDGLVVRDMIYPIPSDVAAFDSDGDSATDRIYVGDTGGQMWRIDLEPNRDSGTSGFKARAGILAKVSNANAPADQRKFFYPPSIIQVRGAGSLSDQDYDLVSAVTGDRSSPLSIDVHDRIYALRDYHIKALGPDDTNGDGLDDKYIPIPQALDGNPTGTPGVAATPSSSMLDFTTTNFNTLKNDTSATVAATIRADFTASSGYYIRLRAGGDNEGEKGLSAPTTLDGKLFFSTFLPKGVEDDETCSLTEGAGALYGLDAITGSAIYNWNTEHSSDHLGYENRSFVLGAGIPSNPVPIFFPEKVMLLVGIGGGATAVDPEISIPRGRSYWFQQN